MATRNGASKLFDPEYVRPSGAEPSADAPGASPGRGEYERLACLVGGAALTTYGLGKGSWRGLACAAAGIGLLTCGVKGPGAFMNLLDQALVRLRRAACAEADRDVVEEASADSFPASDPPAWGRRSEPVAE